jgi:hypothetical protein
MKSFIASIAILALIGLGVGVSVEGATTADVSATVTAQLVSVSVSDGSIAYGILSLDTTKDTTATGVNDTQTATNDGNVTENLSIRSSDATSSGTTWELAATRGDDAFTHEFSINSGGAWTAFNPDNTTYSTLANTVATSAGQTFDLRIGTPTSSTDSVQHTVTVTVQATAS